MGSGVEVLLVPCLKDNYAPIIHDPATGCTAVVDTPEGGAILQALKSKGWKLTHVLNTHHHWDHTGSNLELKSSTGCTVVGPAGEVIPGLDLAVKEGDQVKVGSLEAQVLEVGGHTAGHIAYYFPKQKVAFVGDTLFVLGCGRVFEGTMKQMWDSLKKLRALPDDTVVYCAHEYTESNLRFVESFQGVPKGDLQTRAQAIRDLREKGLPTVPTLLLHEKVTNPFLRADFDDLRKVAGLPDGAEPHQVFAAVRAAKDNF